MCLAPRETGNGLDAKLEERDCQKVKNKIELNRIKLIENNDNNKRRKCVIVIYEIGQGSPIGTDSWDETSVVELD